MTLKTIQKYRDTGEARAYEGLVQARVTGGQEFIAANNPGVAAKLSAPSPVG